MPDYAPGGPVSSRRLTTPPQPPPPSGGVKVTAAQEVRIAALAAAARITFGIEVPGSIRDLEQTTVGMADRLAGWITDGEYEWFHAGDVPAPTAEDAAHRALMSAWRHLADDPVHAHQLAVVAVRAALAAGREQEGGTTQWLVP